MYETTKHMLACGIYDNHGYHETSRAQELKDDIYEDVQTELSVLFAETCNKLSGMFDTYEQHKAEEARKYQELLSYHTYIALTNPGRSGKTSRKWLKKHAIV